MKSDLNYILMRKAHDEEINENLKMRTKIFNNGMKLMIRYN